MIWKIENDAYDSSKNSWTYIHNAKDLQKPSQTRSIIYWDSSIGLEIVRHWLTQNQQIKIVVHILNGEAATKLPHLLSSFPGRLKHLFYYQENPYLSRKERFEIATFLGEHSLRRINPNPQLRELYKYWSYQVLLQENGLDNEQWRLLKEEQDLNPSPNFPSSQEAWVNSISRLILTGSADSVDLPSVITTVGLPISIFKKLAKKFFNMLSKPSVEGLTEFSSDDALPKIQKVDPRTWKKVLITGWYGTETAGDKAILGEIIHQLRSYNSELEIVISSIDLRVSWQTRIEMNLNVRHIPIQRMSNLLDDPDLDAVVMGGGPLMESSQIVPIAKLFDGAAKRGINRVIFGCGVGPIHTDSMSAQIAHIIKVSNVAFYRDQESLDYALRLGGNPEKSLLACDPATAFVDRWKRSAGVIKPQPKISTALREQTAEYETTSDIEGQNLVFPKRMVSVLTELSKEKSGLNELNLISMHVYWRGNDDRRLNLKIAEETSSELKVLPCLRYKGIYEVIESLSESQVSIAMRYHGHIFSIALNIPFLSLDYTGKKGKVSNLMSRIKLDEYSVKFKDFTSDLIQDKLNALSENTAFTATLKNRSEELTKELENAYQHFWQ